MILTRIPIASVVFIALACSGSQKPGAAPANESSVGAWTVTQTGIGPVRAGMTLDEANAKIANILETVGPLQPACDFVAPANHKPDVLLMVVNGHVRRIDIRDSTIKTENGARIGISEDSLLALYAGRFAIGAHKYTGGHYVVVQPANPRDSFRIVFETGEGKVTTFRSGLEPQVEWVEGCS
jgi:hypothetical protein